MDREIIIEQVNANKAVELSDLAKKIYQQYYLYLWHEGGAEWYMNEYAYPVGKLFNELLNPNNLHFIAYHHQTAVGYMKISLNPATTNTNDAELERIYIDEIYAGKGLGKRFIHLAIAESIKYQKQNIFLKAMDSAIDAITFYKKMGFEYAASFQLPMPVFHLMKEEFRGMIVLNKPLLQNNS